jgi:hypothetical protein
MKNVLKLLCAIALLFSCATATAQKDLFPDAKITKADDTIVVSAKDLAQLKNRISTYWGYRIQDNYTKAFEYEDPKTKETYHINLEDYLSNKARIKYHTIKIKEINFVRNDYAKVTLLIKYTFSFFEPITDEKDAIDKWVKREDGKWYRIFTTGTQPPLEN